MYLLDINEEIYGLDLGVSSAPATRCPITPNFRQSVFSRNPSPSSDIPTRKYVHSNMCVTSIEPGILFLIRRIK